MDNKLNLGYNPNSNLNLGVNPNPEVKSIFSSKNKVKEQKKVLKQEKKKEKAIQNDINKTFYNQGVMADVGSFGTTRRTLLPVQQQTEYAKNGFSVTQDSLNKNVQLQQQYNKVLKSDEFKEKKNNLIEQANNVGYAQYNYDKSVVDNDKIGFGDKAFGSFISGLKRPFDISGGYIQNEKGNIVKLPSQNTLKQDKIMNSYNNNTLLGKAGKLYSYATHELGRIAGTSAIEAVAPGAGSTSYFGSMFLESANQAMLDGYDSDRAWAYAMTSTATEYLTGKFLGSATKGLTGGKASGYEELLNGAFNRLMGKPKLARFLANAGSEATEEFIQEYIDNLNRLAVLDKSTDLKEYGSVFLDGDVLGDAAYSALVGAITGGVAGTLSGKDSNIDNNDVYDIYKSELEETKKKTTNEDTLKKIDNIISEIDNVKNNQNNNTNSNVDITAEIGEITSKINQYESLQENNTITPNQVIELNELKQQLAQLQDQLVTNNTNNTNNIPTVQDIVQQEEIKNNSSNIKLPISQSKGNFESTISTSSNNANLPTVNDLIKYNTNTNPTPNKLTTSPKTAEIVSNLKTNSNHNITYTGSNILLALKETGIEVPASFKYVDRVNTDLTYTTTRELSNQDNIAISNALSQLSSIDPVSINNTNQVLEPVNIPQIRQVDGNIPINQDLFNKYPTVREMFDNEIVNYDGVVNINEKISELEHIDFNNLKELKKQARDIFYKYNNKTSFNNNGNIITVNNSGINESIEKIFNNRKQRDLLREHLLVFSDLGDIIEHSKLSNQTDNRKKERNPDINYWNYYLDGLKINGRQYKLEFDVRSMKDGQNQYRVQRLEADIKKQTNYDGDILNALPPYSQSASDNNIPQVDGNVKQSLPINNNMQNNDVNTSKILNPNEISKLTLEDVNTTPIIQTKKVKTGSGESKFAKNIEKKANFLTEEIKKDILDRDEVKFYEEVTNKGSLEKAFARLNEGGKAETTRWFNNSENISDVDVAEGWILLKQYQDAAAKATNQIEKNQLNRTMIEVAKKMRDMGTKAGQTIQAFNIMNRLTPEGMVYYAQSELTEAYNKMVKNKTKEWIDNNREKFELNPDEVQSIMNIMEEVKNMDDGYDKRVKLAEIQKLMTDKLPPQKGAAIKSWMRISMLFNPKTQVRNVAGNAMIAPVNYFGDMFASYADKLVSKKTGVRTTGNINVKAILKGMKQGAYEATNDYKKGINTKDMEGNRFEITDGKSFNDNSIIGRKLNQTEELLNYVMDVGDRVFSQASFENSLQNQMILNNTTEITQDMIDIARTESLERTWNDNNDYTRFVLSTRAGLNRLMNNQKIFGYGLGDVLIPFAKTPANLTKALVDYSPLGMINTLVEGRNLKNSLENGQYTAQMQHKFVQDLGKATAGTMLYILGVALAQAGITSGKSDDDKDTANFLKNTLGISSYSIKIGNKSFTYDWAQPLAAPLSITSNIMTSKNKESALLESIIASLDSAGSILLEQSFLQSLNDVLSSNDGPVSGLINEVLELPSRAIPTFSKQIADLIDGTQRQTFEYNEPLKSATNSLKAKIPFLSKTLAPSVDTMGREIKKYGGKNNLFNVFLNPANVNTENISTSAKEIYRLYKSTGETNIMPRVSPYYINQDGEKIILNAEQRAEYQKVSGKIIEDNINRLLKTNDYKQMSDTKKAEVVEDIVNYSYNIAKKEVLGIELSNSYQKAYEYSEIGKVSDYYAFKNSIDNTNKDTKKESITNYLVNSNLNNKQLAFLYGSYYSSPEVLNALSNADIPIKEYIKFNSQEFTTNYYTNGKAVPNSRRNKVIKYINGLDLSVAQKALLIKMEYSSYKTYDKQIAQYINSKDISFLDKATILKKAGFTSYDKQIINYVNNMNKTKAEKEEILEDMGFKIRNGRVYSK